MLAITRVLCTVQFDVLERFHMLSQNGYCASERSTISSHNGKKESGECGIVVLAVLKRDPSQQWL